MSQAALQTQNLDTENDAHMSTYVVRFLDATPDEFRGRVRHVSTGEEDNFSSPEELYDFLERMNAAHGLRSTGERDGEVNGEPATEGSSGGMRRNGA